MSPEVKKTPTPPKASRPAKPAEASKKDLNIDLKTLIPKFKKFEQKLSKHFSFIISLAVLLVYLFVVWQIKSLATAEPTQEAQDQALSSTHVPRIDQKAINQIQALENNSPEVHALFNNARTNPFHE